MGACSSKQPIAKTKEKQGNYQNRSIQTFPSASKTENSQMNWSAFSQQTPFQNQDQVQNQTKKKTITSGQMKVNNEVQSTINGIQINSVGITFLPKEENTNPTEYDYDLQKIPQVKETQNGLIQNLQQNGMNQNFGPYNNQYQNNITSPIQAKIQQNLLVLEQRINALPTFEKESTQIFSLSSQQRQVESYSSIGVLESINQQYQLFSHDEIQAINGQ